MFRVSSFLFIECAKSVAFFFFLSGGSGVVEAAAGGRRGERANATDRHLAVTGSTRSPLADQTTHENYTN